MSPGSEPTRPRRQVVAHPATVAAATGRRSPRSTVAREVSEQTAVGQILVRGLVRAQLGLALRLAVAVACPLGGLPLLFAAAPGLRDVQVLGLGLPWLLLGVLVYPLLLAVGWLHVRLAERNEREFAEAVDRT